MRRVHVWKDDHVAAVIDLATDSSQIVAVAILFLIVQQIENTLLVPRIKGSAANMNPALIVILHVVGGTSFGIIGAIAIVPAVAIVRDIWLYTDGRLTQVAEESELTLDSATVTDISLE